MTPERAHEIVKAINDRCLYTMELVKDVGSLEGVSLAEMLEAKAVVVAENRAAQERAKRDGDSYSITTVPADRLIAAAYVLEHYQPDNDAILFLPHTGIAGEYRAVAVMAVDGERTDCEDDAA